MAHSTAKSRQKKRAKVHDKNLGEFVSSPAVGAALTAASFIPGIGPGIRVAKWVSKGVSALKAVKAVSKGAKAVTKKVRKVVRKGQELAPLKINDKGKTYNASRIIKTKKNQRMAQMEGGGAKMMSKQATVKDSPLRRQIKALPVTGSAIGGVGYGISQAKQSQPEPSTEGIQQQRMPQTKKSTPLSQMNLKDTIRQEKAQARLGHHRMNKDKYPIFRKSSVARANWKAKWNKTTEGGTFSYAGRKYKKKS